ncbi:UBIQUITIN/ L40 RIBOSOMAL PROTEIN FUSION [Encephalitozoon cuniculi GB-M1]|uniref:UBIQUITIN/ L40 RIBOSOMAL PROTEIN FUSION n=2 Tax=Encephalitozoon cuniculi TaxID=6035 RepID=Q8SRH8_ENCCU|nr:ubiquitin-60S ribosomal protein L40 fusion protein [Encephalitozoon cuniculi GB-M1]KMV65863.1 ubiquitin/L40 ribosomal protein fusion [Encephalitozoon cuniculi EcunIII-L]UYI27302.1 elongin-B [Encephalitozoon cuniculi]7QEP_P0 Chain P0, UBIQUITIN/ L40 RIBOSOMAL PROTEIN FUSION [Encephalitozoon cuniculi GB-M1]CAD25671.2 UBIQUITIN/ L40 RIBOSOMAL PROTEIN FUSION [Encephalitozoon cuniculi GB-M1]
MQIGVRFCGKTSFVQAEPSQSVLSLKALVGRACGLDSSVMVLQHNSRILEDSGTMAGYGMRTLDTITAYPKLLGGGGNMSDNDAAMAMKEKNDCLICRRCYARSGKAAEKCRKCFSKDLRLKKPLKAMKKK